MTTSVVCVDFGSTWTKALLVDAEQGEVLATASHPTTLPDPDGRGEVLDAYDACVAALAEQDPRAAGAEVLACSSAGGGLRVAVVGNEELVTAEAGRRVALSSGGKVVLVLAGGLDDAKLAGLRAAEPHANSRGGQSRRGTRRFVAAGCFRTGCFDSCALNSSQCDPNGLRTQRAGAAGIRA